MAITCIKKRNLIKLFHFIILVMFITGCKNGPKAVEIKSVTLPPYQPVSKEITVVSPDSANFSKPLPDLIQDRLIGKWLRTDGGYLIEIFSVTKDGTLDAGYFNPKPINVDKAEWVMSENKLYIRIILKDVNYPGSTYTLIYYPENDALAGNYFQAVQGTNFDVVFQRKKQVQSVE